MPAFTHDGNRAEWLESLSRRSRKFDRARRLFAGKGKDMTTQLPGVDSWLDDFLVWREEAVEEAWEMAACDSDAVPDLANSFDITDLQHWLDLCA
jgi:hypothetical protein